MIIVSSCLLGIYSKYDGGDNARELLLRHVSLGKFIPLCPEQLGGMPTPRQPAELVLADPTGPAAGRRVLTKDGADVSRQFHRGAAEVLAIARSFPVTAAILKERSPSCGVHKIYDGSFGGILIPGQGLTAALLRQQGLPVYADTEITAELLAKLLELC
jgi:uncharacterized protein YbbK (DUF523 family)